MGNIDELTLTDGKASISAKQVNTLGGVPAKNGIEMSEVRYKWRL
jgi:hypothetical protein